MKISVFSLFVITIISALACPAISGNAWEDNGTPISRAFRNQESPLVISDGAGGAFIIWEDDRYPHMYAQRIDPRGNTMWADDGAPVVMADGQRYRHCAISDGAGGVIIAYEDNRVGNYGIYAQRLGPDGNMLWGSAGIAVCYTAESNNHPVIAPDGMGGCYIVWRRWTGLENDLYAQRVSSGGSPYWTTNGIAICTTPENQSDQKVINDGDGDMIVTWEDYRDGTNWHIYAQKVESDGSILWTAGGEAVCVNASTKLNPELLADGYGGAFICWLDDRDSSPYDLFGQRLDKNGTFYWTSSGHSLCTAPGNQNVIEMLSDGEEGFFLTWQDDRSGAHDIYIQRINPEGSRYWGSSGEPVCTSGGLQYSPELAPDGAGGVFVVWEDQRAGNYDVYASRVDKYGDVHWPADGVAIADGVESEHDHKIMSNGDGGLIVAWQKYQNSYFDIYAQKIDFDGNWGIPEPGIRAVRDVPGDQGGLVNVTWDASQYDPGVSLITAYTVWRAIAPEAAMMLVKDGARLVESASEIELPDDLSADLDIVRMQLYGASDYYWTLVGTHDAFYLESYSLPTGTLFDSTAVSDEYHYFQVIAHTANPTVFFVSAPDSGYSVDNLAPCPPLNIAGDQLFTPVGLELSWSPNTEPDLDCYHIYRGIGPGFDPRANNLLSEQCDTLLLDGGWSWDSGFCYKVAAVDVNGNESGFTTLCMEQVTGDDPMPLPDATFLAQNFPNPFNPSTRIGFGMKDAGHVSLQIYDAAGRLVRTLLDETRPAGSYEMTWNGLDNGGNQVSSGVYFYRLNAGDFLETRKMVLLR